MAHVHNYFAEWRIVFKASGFDGDVAQEEFKTWCEGVQQ